MRLVGFISGGVGMLLAGGDTGQMPENRLTIGHLLLWMATTSLVMAAVQKQWERPRTLSEAYSGEAVSRTPYERAVRVLTFAVSPAYGAAIAAAVLGIWRRWKGVGGFPSQPGHWLLLLLCPIPITTALRWELKIPIELAIVVELILVLGMAILASRFNRHLVFWAAALRSLVSGLSIVSVTVAFLASSWLMENWAGPVILAFGFVGALALIAALLCITSASIIDLTSDECYDVFHWTGVVAFHVVVVHLFAPTFLNGL